MRRNKHEFHCIVFVRNDVYDHVMRQSPDYGKEMRATLDWSDGDMLREMLRLRLVSNLAESERNKNFFTMWRQLCESHYAGEESSAYLIDRSLMRPRNLLKIFNHCRGFATNFQRQRITVEDINRGLLAYSQDLIEELDRELTDVFPEARDLLSFLDGRRFCRPPILSELSPQQKSTLRPMRRLPTSSSITACWGSGPQIRITSSSA